MIDKIIDHLFLSDAGSVIGNQSVSNFEKYQITHVLTISAAAVEEHQKVNGVTYMYIWAMDLETQDLLIEMDSALTFIQDAIDDGGNVLVHCEAGVSRSVTIVAAYLMSKFQWTVEKAILLIQSKRPTAGPNAGFMRQLNVFRAMGYRADPQTLRLSQEYRNWCAESGTTPQTGSGDGQKQILDESEPHQRKYRCRLCRRVLFFDTHIMQHEPEVARNGEKCPVEYFVTPMEWMTLRTHDEKISCPNPNCSEKLGHYTAEGRKCPGEQRKCDRHVMPWIHIQKGKVDGFLNSALVNRNFAAPPTIVISKAEPDDE